MIGHVREAQERLTHILMDHDLTLVAGTTWCLARTRLSGERCRSQRPSGTVSWIASGGSPTRRLLMAFPGMVIPRSWSGIIASICEAGREIFRPWKPGGHWR